jgi:transcriptional regulator with XRE-family HTH domain
VIENKDTYDFWPQSPLVDHWDRDPESQQNGSVAMVFRLRYDALMSSPLHLQAWRVAKHHTLESLAEKSGVEPAYLSAVESGESDCTVSMLQALAASLGIPPSWLYGHPDDLNRIFQEEDEEVSAAGAMTDATDPVLERILRSVGRNRTLYAMIAALLQCGDERLIRAAEVSLRSLVKQANQTTQALVPWLTRPSGHFEPPSD